MKKQYVTLSAALAVIVVALIIGLCCVDWKSDSAASSQAAVEKRMADPEYVAKLEHQAAERTRLFKELSQARKAYQAAKDSGVDAATLKRLQDNWEKASRAFQRNDQVSQLIVREELLKEKK